jgi:hypothetical protein
MRLPLRGFQLVSDTLVYAGDTAQVVFSTKTQNFSRAAIVGIGVAADVFDVSLFHSLDRFEVAGRPYKQGDALPLGLLAMGPNPGPGLGQSLNFRRSYFPGTKIPLSDGTYCSGILVNGREDIRLQVTRLPGVAAIRQIVLNCLEFPRGAYPAGIQQAVDQLWDRFAAGIGQFHCVANFQNLAALTAFQATLEVLVNPPHRQNSRRTEIRGGLIDPVAVAYNETEFDNVSLQIFGQGAGATPTSNQGVPARQIAGNSALSYTDQVGLDFERDSRSLILVQAPPFPAERALALVTLFEGTDDKGVKLCGPAVF